MHRGWKIWEFTSEKVTALGPLPPGPPDPEGASADGGILLLVKPQPLSALALRAVMNKMGRINRRRYFMSTSVREAKSTTQAGGKSGKVK